MLKKIFSILIYLMFFILGAFPPTFANDVPIKIMSLHYDDDSSLIYITSIDGSTQIEDNSIKPTSLSSPNRIYFDINNAVLIGEKQQLVFEKSPIKEIRLAQFETDPNKIVRAVITFEEDFDTSKVKIYSVDGNLIVKIKNPRISNDYFNTIYDESPITSSYSSIAVNSQFVQKVLIPVQGLTKAPENVIDDIERAFENSTLSNADGKTFDSTVSVDLSSNLKLRTKYYINQYIAKNSGLLVSGLGQLTTAKIFYLQDPDRLVIDLPNSFLDRKIRNQEINLCNDTTCNDVAKIGQFEFDKSRIVINSKKAKKYLPIYSTDSQSMFIVDTDNLNHTELVSNISNINKAFVRRIDNKTNELIFSFSSPVIHSILRNENSLNLFFFNVQSYNEQDLIKTLNGTYFNRLVMSLLPKVGVKVGLPLNKSDIVKVEQSVDSKAIKITITRGTQDTVITEKPLKRGIIKGKIVLDAGHGGSDYGAIREGINEKDITLEISQRVESILRSKGFKVSLVRNDDTFVSLEDRVAFTEKEEPEAFVSIHVNSAVSNTPCGIETHWYHDSGKNLAEIIHKNLIKQIPSAKDRGLFKSKFYVINHTSAPAVLCEIGFLSNPDERNELITESRKQRTAKAIAEGIIEYLKGKK